ncbi:MAG: endonuclease V [Desulfurococcaceae archaeon]
MQSRLSQLVLKSIEEAPRLYQDKIRFIAAFDSSYIRGNQCAVVVIYDLSRGNIIEKEFAIEQVNVPYMPGFLAFREIPGYMRAYSKLHVEPDLVLVDGHGLAHPRSFGIASHLGLVLDKPSIGIAKHKLYGEIIHGDQALYIYAHGRKIGVILRHMNTDLYVSIGYKIRLEDAVDIVKKLLVEGKKLPIPLQEADEYSKTIKNKYC